MHKININDIAMLMMPMRRTKKKKTMMMVRKRDWKVGSLTLAFCYRDRHFGFSLAHYIVSLLAAL